MSFSVTPPSALAASVSLPGSGLPGSGDRPLACVILAAGMGTRMRSALPKVMHPVAGVPMLRHVLDAACALQPERLVVVVGPEMEAVSRFVAPWPTVVQTERRGTADALRAALPELAGFPGTVLVLYGDTPLLRAETLAGLATALTDAAAEPAATHEPAAVAVLGMRPADPAGYGRLVLGSDGHLERIVEHLDACPEERAIGLCNGGLMAFDGERLAALLAGIGNQNAKGEFYLTDAVAVARTRGWRCAVVEGPAEEVLGVNARSELAHAEALLQTRLRLAAMAGGATLTDPASVFLCADTVLGRDVRIGPQVVFGPGVTVGDGVEILPFCHLEQVQIAAGVRVGPFARLRPGTTVGQGAHIGNFVELKNATVASGAKVNHLSYIGDATIGADANIGAGTITCNYDGKNKFRTEIGAGAFIGSNTALVAPVAIGAGALVGAGSVITASVPAEALAVARGSQKTLAGGATRFRSRSLKPKSSAETPN